MEFHLQPGDYLDVDTNQLKPGWIPEGWERGDTIKMQKGLYQFSFFRFVFVPFTPETATDSVTNEVSYHFENYRLPEFYEWLAWWNYE